MRLLIALATTLTAMAFVAQAPVPEATSLLGVPLHAPADIPNRADLEANLRAAESVADPTTADAIIWLGRRQAYLWRYQGAIATFTRGTERYPDDPRMYRHRGQRYITTRRFALAEADFEKAAALMTGKPDEIEPDGAPNPSGQPRSTLHFNVWYRRTELVVLSAGAQRLAATGSLR